MDEPVEAMGSDWNKKMVLYLWLTEREIDKQFKETIL